MGYSSCIRARDSQQRKSDVDREQLAPEPDMSDPEGLCEHNETLYTAESSSSISSSQSTTSSL